jgi:hypothetical protein
MKVYIRQDEDGQFALAYYAFKLMGWEINHYQSFDAIDLSSMRLASSQSICLTVIEAITSNSENYLLTKSFSRSSTY